MQQLQTVVGADAIPLPLGGGWVGLRRAHAKSYDPEFTNVRINREKSGASRRCAPTEIYGRRSKKKCIARLGDKEEKSNFA